MKLRQVAPPPKFYVTPKKTLTFWQISPDMTDWETLQELGSQEKRFQEKTNLSRPMRNTLQAERGRFKFESGLRGIWKIQQSLSFWINISKCWFPRILKISVCCWWIERICLKTLFSSKTRLVNWKDILEKVTIYQLILEKVKTKSLIRMNLQTQTLFKV